MGLATIGENCASKKTFAQVVTAGLKSSAAQVSFIKAAEIANDTEKRNAAVILDKVELPENVSDDGQFGQALLKACEVQEDSVSVFRLKKMSRPAVAQDSATEEGRCQKNDVTVQQNQVNGSRLLVCHYSSRPVEARARKATCGMEGSCNEEQQSRRVSLHCEKPGMCEGAIQRGRSPSRLGNSRNAYIKHPVSTLKVGYANCCSVVNKIPLLELTVNTLLLDIVCLTETKLDNSITDSILSLNNSFSVIRKDRDRHGGGVAVLISKLLNFSIIKIPDSFGSLEVVGVDVLLKSGRLRVLSVYHPNHNLSYDSLLDCLKDLISVRGNCIIFGDFNAPHVDWANLKASDPKCRKLLSFSIKCGLKQHVMSPTRLNPDNVLDLCFTNTDIVNEITVGDLFSDHRFVHVSLSRQRKNSQKVSTVKCFRKGSFDEINCIRSRIDWDLRFSTLTVEEMYQDLVALLSNLIDKFIPVKILKPSTKLHSSDIRKLQKKKLDVWRSEGNSVNYRALALLLRTRLSLEEKRITENRLCEGSSPHAFYKFVNSRWKSDEKIGILRDSAAGEDVTDDITKASLFSDTFSSVYTTDDGCASEFPVRTSQCLSSVDVSPHVVEFHLSHLPLKANTTPEGIPSIFLKRACTSLALPLSIIYQRSLQYSIVPTVWKSAIVKPLYKKGSRCDPKNYRPISLTSSVCKVLEKIVRCEVTKHLNVNRLIIDRQYGFRSNRGTVSQLLSYQSALIGICMKKLVTHSVYVDFKKAFDTVSPKKLEIKLHSYGISGSLLCWLTSFLTGRNQVVCVNGSLSACSSVMSGVPQGSVLGPLLFLLYINDIGDNFKSNYLLYADDLKIFSHSSSDVQHDLDVLSDWCRTWQLDVAPNKFKPFF
uniref:Reverse transcriptase domain-containing protein n=1 Tax=Caenorhabditis japonica TaxID=281687 RepID=A0A8R1HR31_CAEJA